MTFKNSWLKLKKDYLGSGVADSVDVLVMGAYYGKGKRSGNYGGFLLGVYDADNEEYQTVCKLGTGLTDENLKLVCFKDLSTRDKILSLPSLLSG